ncbi:MAG: zinc ribbon domain-containing protein [Candidatus Methanomethylophilaceae archaeon]|nr:zinc ribbon domain-containing protein [Candidatus Methanomethylophilaceae archaeon]
MYCESCGSEVSGEYGFCPVCGARLDPSSVQEVPIQEERPADGKVWAIRIGAAAAGALIGFLVSYFLGWMLFILVPVFLFGTGAGEIRSILNFFALGLLAGMMIGLVAGSTHFILRT